MATKKEKKSKGKKERVKEEVKESVSREEQIKAQNKILKNILIGIVVIIVGIFLFVVISNSLSRFEYRGVDFEIVRFCDAGPPCLVTYRTSLPVKTVGTNIVIVKPSEKDADYNFYLRNDPRELNVNFTGEIFFSNNMVLNSEEPFICDGKGAIAAANLIQLYEVLGTKVINDENATCDLLGRYLFVQVNPGNKTRVRQFGPGCYNIDIKDCEILEGTERFMIETLVKVNEDLKE